MSIDGEKELFNKLQHGKLYEFSVSGDDTMYYGTFNKGADRYNSSMVMNKFCGGTNSVMLTKIVYIADVTVEVIPVMDRRITDEAMVRR